MHISLPDEQRIPLGEDVDTALGARFRRACASPSSSTLRALFARFGIDQSEPFGFDAIDWANLNERMHFIIDLFRTTQFEVRLFEQPFAPVFRLELDARFAGASVRPRPTSDPVRARSR